METLFAELKRYVGWDTVDERVLRGMHPLFHAEFVRIADLFYRRILDHAEARKVLFEGESQVGRLKVTLVAWMHKLFLGPWDEEYFDTRCRIGRVHVRIALPQHYMFGAMNIVRQEMNQLIDHHFVQRSYEELRLARVAVGKILDLELAIMLHTYREDYLAQAARHERLSTFGQLVGSIGHELRNPLGVIESSLYILKGRVAEDERARKHIDRIAEQLGIANGIITALLEMIRERPLAFETVQLPLVVDSAMSTITVPEGVTVARDGLDTLPQIQADARQIRQVLHNLIENAVHAVCAAGRPEGEAPRVTVAGRREDEHVVLSVTDNGPGIDPSVRARLFEPLVSTKAKGIGLGLALVKRIAERHGGYVVCESGPGGRGARFIVQLPVSQRAVPSA